MDRHFLVRPDPDAQHHGLSRVQLRRRAGELDALHGTAHHHLALRREGAALHGGGDGGQALGQGGDVAIGIHRHHRRVIHRIPHVGQVSAGQHGVKAARLPRLKVQGALHVQPAQGLGHCDGHLRLVPEGRAGHRHCRLPGGGRLDDALAVHRGNARVGALKSDGDAVVPRRRQQQGGRGGIRLPLPLRRRGQGKALPCKQVHLFGQMQVGCAAPAQHQYHHRQKPQKAHLVSSCHHCYPPLCLSFPFLA